MPFTAFGSAPRSVRFGTDEEAQGNGSIEVIEVYDTTSLCRVTHQQGQGRDRQRAQQESFSPATSSATSSITTTRRASTASWCREISTSTVTSVATSAERNRVISLIQSWGGIVEDKVTSPVTDYLVIGSRPSLPTTIEQASDSDKPAATSPALESGSVAEQRKNEQDSYDDVIVQASRLAIPVLNANRFLSLVGYYNTTIVKY